MGKSPEAAARDLISKANRFAKQDFGQVPTYDYFYLFTQGWMLMGAAKLELILPPGNYEIEASALIYNHNDHKYLYSSFLTFFLDDNEQYVWESGEIGFTDHARPYKHQYKVWASFTKSKTIEWALGSDAPQAFGVENPCITAKRIGAIKEKVV